MRLFTFFVPFRSHAMLLVSWRWSRIWCEKSFILMETKGHIFLSMLKRPLAPSLYEKNKKSCVYHKSSMPATWTSAPTELYTRVQVTAMIDRVLLTCEQQFTQKYAAQIQTQIQREVAAQVAAQLKKPRRPSHLRTPSYIS